MSIIRDIIDTVKDIADHNELSFTNNKPKGSLTRMTKDAVLQFPVIASRAVDIQLVQLVTKSLERNFGSLVKIAFSLNAITTEKDLTNYIRQFHQNTNSSEREYITNVAIDAAVNESNISYDVRGDFSQSEKALIESALKQDNHRLLKEYLCELNNGKLNDKYDFALNEVRDYDRAKRFEPDRDDSYIDDPVLGVPPRRRSNNSSSSSSDDDRVIVNTGNVEPDDNETDKERRARMRAQVNQELNDDANRSANNNDDSMSNDTKRVVRDADNASQSRGSSDARTSTIRPSAQGSKPQEDDIAMGSSYTVRDKYGNPIHLTRGGSGRRTQSSGGGSLPPVPPNRNNRSVDSWADPNGRNKGNKGNKKDNKLIGKKDPNYNKPSVPKDFKTSAKLNPVITKYSLARSDKMFTDQDVKKSNEIMPLAITVGVYIQDPKSGNTINQEFILGIKGVIHPVSSEYMVASMLDGYGRNKSFFNFIKATTGEISFFKDFVFMVDKLKSDAVKNASKGDKWFSMLKRRAMLAKSKRILRMKSQLLPNTSILLSANEVEAIKAEGVDLLDPGVAIKIIDQYFLLAIVVVDEGLETVSAIYDGDKKYAVNSFTALTKDAKEDSATKQILNLIKSRPQF